MSIVPSAPCASLAMSLVLHTYWRSSAAYRVRIGLNLKGLDYQLATHDLRAGEQRAPGYRALAPLGLVPALETGDAVLTESLAILEWLDERHPTPPLLPRDADDRAIVRAMAQIVACDIHPLNNLRVLRKLKHDLGADDAALQHWAQHWIAAGFTVLEQMAREHGEGFCFGPTPTIADCCLIPQLYNARRSETDLTPWPTLCAIEARCAALPAFAAAHPAVQPGADPAPA